jgi:hypothetical protein
MYGELLRSARTVDQRHGTRIVTVDVDVDLVPNVDLNGDVDVEPIVDLARRPPGQFNESSSRSNPKMVKVEDNDRVNVNVAVNLNAVGRRRCQGRR